MIDTTMETKIIEVIGIKTDKLGFSIRMSPGNLPNQFKLKEV